jgi:hypothetical protein
MFGDFISIFQNLIPEVIPSQKYPRNVGLILKGYGAIETSCCSFSAHVWAAMDVDVFKQKPAHY